MQKRKHTKESIIQTLQNQAKQLQKNLSMADVAKILSISSISYHFGSLGNALEAAGLERTKSYDHFVGRGKVISDESLFQSLLAVENKIGHEPGHNEYLACGEYSNRPFRKRFGKWKDVLAHYRKWKADKSIEIEKGAIYSEPQEGGKVLEQKTGNFVKMHLTVDRKPPGQLYGEAIDFRGLRHAPINEHGVVYLFGMVSKELGFYVEALQQGFPDCEGKYLYDRKKNLWAKARIEFEYKASSFKEHGHDTKQCDFIVCWINDWPDCPINVIELKTQILKLPSK